MTAVAPENAELMHLQDVSLDREEEEDENVVRKDTEEYVQDLKDGKSNILVAVRVRGLLPAERSTGGRAIMRVLDRKVVVLMDPGVTAPDDYLRLNKSKEKRYAFDFVFDEHCGQTEVFNNTTKFLIDGVLNGYTATVFSYGATGAGKTYTMLGSTSEPGIMALTLQDLFLNMNSKLDNVYEVRCSFIEVYNENLRDLLAPSDNSLDLREDPVKGMCVAGVSEVSGLKSAKEILDLLHQGNRNRTTEPTCANVVSSRSHAVLQIIVEQRDRTRGEVEQVNVGKLSMIDLAGSERASQTNNKGIRMLEGANINRSLLALGNCITALADQANGGKGTFVPYRDSKLTRMLKDSLGGSCRTVMIANVGPCHVNYEDTHNTLKYANRAKNIKTKIVRNVLSVAHHISKYTHIIQELRSEVSALKTRLADQAEADGVPSRGMEQNPNFAMEQQRSEAWKQEVLENFEERVQLRRALLDGENRVRELLVDRGKAQVEISQWETRGGQEGKESSGSVDGEMSSTPRSIQSWHQQLRNLQTQLAHAAQTNEDLKVRLAENMRTLHQLESSLPQRVKNNDLRAFLQLIYRVQALQIENMALEDANQSTNQVLKSKDLEIEKLKLQVHLRDKIIEEHQSVLTDSQRQMLGKHVSFLPCKTVAKWEGEQVAEPLSGRGNAVKDVKVPEVSGIASGAMQVATSQVTSVLRERERESSSDARRRAGSADESAARPDGRDSSVDRGRPRLQRPVTHDYALPPRPQPRPGLPAEGTELGASTQEGRTPDRSPGSASRPVAPKRDETPPRRQIPEGRFLPHIKAGQGRTPMDERSRTPIRLPDIRLHDGSEGPRVREEDGSDAPARSDDERGSRGRSESARRHASERKDRSQRARTPEGKPSASKARERPLERTAERSAEESYPAYAPPVRQKRQPPRQYLPYATPSKVMAPVPVPKAQASGRLARHRKRARGHSNSVHRAWSGYRGEAGHRGPYARQERKQWTWQVKERDSSVDRDNSQGREDHGQAESYEDVPRDASLGREGEIPRKDIIRKLNADFEARKAMQDSRLASQGHRL